MNKYSVHNGNKVIEDIRDPKYWEIDILNIPRIIRRIYRFSFHEKALSVFNHSLLVEYVAMGRHGKSSSFAWWALRHDWHEAIITDLIRPFKYALDEETNVHREIAKKLDVAICLAQGRNYPSDEVIKEVEEIDKICLYFEAKYIIGIDPGFHMEIHPYDFDSMVEFCEELLNIRIERNKE